MSLSIQTLCTAPLTSSCSVAYLAQLWQPAGGPSLQDSLPLLDGQPGKGLHEGKAACERSCAAQQQRWQAPSQQAEQTAQQDTVSVSRLELSPAVRQSCSCLRSVSAAFVHAAAGPGCGCATKNQCSQIELLPSCGRELQVDSQHNLHHAQVSTQLQSPHCCCQHLYSTCKMLYSRQGSA